MKLRNITSFSILLIFTLPLFSQPITTVEEISTTFFEKFSHNSDDAFDYLFGTNPWMKNNADGVNNVKFKVRESANLMGEYIGHEIINEKMVGTSMKAEIHLAKYERQPLRFIFMYYKPKDTWMVYNFSFDEKLDDDLEAHMKSTYLDPKK